MGARIELRWHRSGDILVFSADGWVRGFVWWEERTWRAVCNLGIGADVELEDTNKRKLQRAVECKWKQTRWLIRRMK